MLQARDTGRGMDPATLDRVFEPFFSTKSASEGAGLGLASVYGIVKQSGGLIAVASEPGRGTTFTLYFPRHEGSGPIGVAADAREPAGGTETVLLVEDEDQVRELARRVLERVGYTVLAAADAEAATAIADRHPGHIHLLVTDILLPQLSGRELAARLSIHRPAIKVLYISGTNEGSGARLRLLEPGTPVPRKAVLPRPPPSNHPAGARRPGERSASAVTTAGEVEAYRVLFECNPLPMWVYDSETLAFLEVNDAAVREYGYSRVEFLRMTILDIRPEEDRATVAQVSPQLPDDLQIWAIPWRHCRRDGSTCLVRVSSYPLQFAGRPGRLVVAQDVTEVTRAAEELRQNSERYRFFIGRTAEGVWRAAVEPPIPLDLPEDDQVERCTRDVRLVEVNDAMVRMYGCHAPDELVGTQLSSTFDLADARSLEFFRAFVRSGYRTVELESFEFDRHGAPHWFVNNLLGVVEGGPADGRLGDPAGRHGAAPERGDGAGDARPPGGDRRGVAAPDRRGRHRRRSAELEPRRRTGVRVDRRRGDRTTAPVRATRATGRVRRFPRRGARRAAVHRTGDGPGPEGRHPARHEHLHRADPRRGG